MPVKAQSLGTPRSVGLWSLQGSPTSWTQISSAQKIAIIDFQGHSFAQEDILYNLSGVLDVL